MNIRKKNKSPAFKIGFIIYIAVMAAAITAGLAVFYNFTAAYEKTLPEHEAEKFVSGLGFDSLSRLIEECSPYGDNRGELVKGRCREELKGKNIGFRKNVREYTDENPVYILSAGGGDFGDITLSKNEKYAFGFYTWKIDKAEIYRGFYDRFPYSVTITAPAGSVVETDGVPAGESDIESGYIPNGMLSEFETRLAGKYYYLSYKIGGLIDEVDIKVTLEGAEIPLTEQNGENYLFEYPAGYPKDYEITVPTGSGLTVNGIPADEKYIKKIIGQPEKLGAFEKGLGLTETVYLIPGLFDPPAAEAVYGGAGLDIFENGRTIYFDTPEKTRYNITVSLPEGAALKINGAAVPDGYLPLRPTATKRLRNCSNFRGP